jgi:hypothetical protein
MFDSDGASRTVSEGGGELEARAKAAGNEEFGEEDMIGNRVIVLFVVVVMVVSSLAARSKCHS